MVTRICLGTHNQNPHYNCHVSPISPLLMSYKNAINNLNWQHAMLDEYNTLIKNDNRVLVPRSPNANIVRSMWLLKHKYFAYGTLSWHKARVVASRNSQQIGVDYDDTFSQAPRAWFQRYASYATRVFDDGSWLVELLFGHLYLPHRGWDVSLPEELCCRDSGARWSLAGALQYLTFTCLDLSYVVQWVCLYIMILGPHLTALKRILPYVTGTLDYGLHLYASSTSSLVAYSDRDWVGFPTTRRSTFGYCIFLGQVRVLHVSSRYQYADIFSNGLSFSLFDDFRTSLTFGFLSLQLGGC
uniref:Ribonuclease H-like domain-containing protein n=1 Tax=Tanacetum cinerariifolium TaxID=118510 RepID=A0A6L2JMZ5_TANCI|nr:ribonuclease H-like domain-containing protein [Tanacetum cinerariifolium]